MRQHVLWELLVAELLRELAVARERDVLAVTTDLGAATRVEFGHADVATVLLLEPRPERPISDDRTDLLDDRHTDNARVESMDGRTRNVVLQQPCVCKLGMGRVQLGRDGRRLERLHGLDVDVRQRRDDGPNVCVDKLVLRGAVRVLDVAVHLVYVHRVSGVATDVLADAVAVDQPNNVQTVTVAVKKPNEFKTVEQPDVVETIAVAVSEPDAPAVSLAVEEPHIVQTKQEPDVLQTFPKPIEKPDELETVAVSYSHAVSGAKQSSDSKGNNRVHVVVADTQTDVDRHARAIERRVRRGRSPDRMPQPHARVVRARHVQRRRMVHEFWRRTRHEHSVSDVDPRPFTGSSDDFKFVGLHVRNRNVRQFVLDTWLVLDGRRDRHVLRCWGQLQRLDLDVPHFERRKWPTPVSNAKPDSVTEPSSSSELVRARHLDVCDVAQRVLRVHRFTYVLANENAVARANEFGAVAHAHIVRAIEKPDVVETVALAVSLPNELETVARADVVNSITRPIGIADVIETKREPDVDQTFAKPIAKPDNVDSVARSDVVRAVKEPNNDETVARAVTRANNNQTVARADDHQTF